MTRGDECGGRQERGWFFFAVAGLVAHISFVCESVCARARVPVCVCVCAVSASVSACVGVRVTDSDCGMRPGLAHSDDGGALGLCCGMAEGAFGKPTAQI